ncbi:MAG: adenine nucleotide alpha hydrolase [Alphaproteobacteria bacterium]|nr:MAG: adenine nucleotide alpha hydrolase [Alphaproteobacteria bacterium]
MTRPKALIAWSSGKDSAWALHEVRRAGEVEIVGALTTVTETFARVSMHGVREEILRAQHAALGLPPVIVPIPYPCPNEIYEARMAAALENAKRQGVTQVIFGDLFLEDVRAYREQKLAGTGITPLFPLWRRPTQALAREMIDAGVDTYLVCVDLKQLPKSFAGRRFDLALLADLPPSVDPCGENGEFHTCVVAGPMFDRRIEVQVGETVERDGFVYTDLVPATPLSSRANERSERDPGSMSQRV